MQELSYHRELLKSIIYNYKDAPAQGFDSEPCSVLETGIDALFTLLRRENRTELLPQLLHLQTAHRAVCFTAQPKGSIPVRRKVKEDPDGILFYLVLETGIEPATY